MKTRLVKAQKILFNFITHFSITFSLILLYFLFNFYGQKGISNELLFSLFELFKF